MELISDSLNSLSDCSKDAEEDYSVESLLFNSDDEDNDFVINDLATLIILTDFVTSLFWELMFVCSESYCIEYKGFSVAAPVDFLKMWRE